MVGGTSCNWHKGNCLKGKWVIELHESNDNHNKFSAGFVPPTGTSQSGGQFLYQASAHRLPPQQSDAGYQPTLAQSQSLQQGI